MAKIITNGVYIIGENEMYGIETEYPNNFNGWFDEETQTPNYSYDGETVRECTESEREAWREAHQEETANDQLEEIQMALVELADIVAEIMGG